MIAQNGSGKSSLAEALEWAITGRCARLTDPERVNDWWSGVVNRHSAAGSAQVSVTLHVDGPGEAEPVELTTQLSGTTKRDLADTRVTGRLGSIVDQSLVRTIAEATAEFRPFLSHHQLSRAFERGNSSLHIIAPVLGLQDMLDAKDTLSQLVPEQPDKAGGPTAEHRIAVGTALAALADEFADPELAALATLIADSSEAAGSTTLLPDQEHDGRRAAIDALASSEVPSATLLNDRLDAFDEARELYRREAADSAASGDEVAQMLSTVISMMTDAPAMATCPLCEAPLSDGWLARSRSRLDDHQATASRRQAAREQLNATGTQARALFERMPTASSIRDASAALSITADEIAGAEMVRQRLSNSAVSWDGTMRSQLRELLVSWSGLQERAAKHQRERWAERDQQRAAALKIAEWDAAAHAYAEQKLRLDAARTWITKELRVLASERFLRTRNEILGAWAALRQTSSVTLDDVSVHLTRGTKRGTLNMTATVDETSVKPISVASQGELYSLGLSLFVPYAKSAASPFRFTVIDDPVQSMDPAKVAGLAQLLASLSRDRQVVVFTHDLRLERAIVKQGIDARIVRVRRVARQVTIEESSSTSIELLLRDAESVLHSNRVPESTKLQIVPVLLRQALEAAFAYVVAYRDAHGTPTLPGMDVEEQETALSSAVTLSAWMKTALGSSGRRGWATIEQLVALSPLRVAPLRLEIGLAFDPLPNHDGRCLRKRHRSHRIALGTTLGTNSIGYHFGYQTTPHRPSQRRLFPYPPEPHTRSSVSISRWQREGRRFEPD